MKTITTFVFALALASPAVFAGEPNYGCDSVNFGDEVLAKMPNAQALCRGIAEKNGGIYVHYIAEVESRDASTVTVKFLDKDDKPVTRVKFEPTADQTVMMDKKPVKYSSLKKGEKIDVWVENKKWGLYANPGSPAMKITSVEHL